MNFLKVLLNLKDLPHPQVDWNAFSHTVKTESSTQHLIFDPLDEQFKLPVDMAELKRAYGKASCACSVM